MKSQPIKLGVYKVICLAVKHHGHGPAAQTAIIQSLQYYEHLSEPMAECLNVLLKEFDHAQLSEEILREILKIPRSYPMRMGIVETIGCLIRELACSEDLTSDAHQTQKQLNGLYDLLLQRTLDLSISSYVRSKVFTVLSRLCDLPVKSPKQRLAITRAAVSALEDKVAGVRRNAISLIVKLMVTHPYGLMHGGLLGMEWEDRYREVVKELQKTEKYHGRGRTRVLQSRGWRRDHLDMVFRKLQEAIEHPCRSRERFALAEQAISTLYALGDQPEVLSNTVIKILSRRAFRRRERLVPSAAEEQGALTGNTAKESDDTGDAFELNQLLFVVDHVAVKQIVYLELVEREWKRQKQENELAEKLARGTGNDAASKDGEELDQVAGNAEDEIGDRIATVRETELLYGPDSLLALYGPLLVRICGWPDQFKNTTLRAVATLSFSKFLCVSSQFCDANHYLLFRILETSRDPNIRSNIAIALGDVAVSFSRSSMRTAMSCTGVCPIRTYRAKPFISLNTT
ncbi:hypothetical protein BGW80DRAFT_1441454 [Lactifluus volemus]|nr:hypothetical protein BGW80DRAFT_1441454 [Lactifluus volemus]